MPGAPQGTKAGTLLEAPTQALADEAAAEHTPTEEEKALVIVYWAFLVSSQQSGSFDPIVLQSGLQEKVVALAAGYPTFFTQTPQAGQDPGPGGWYTESVNSPADFACNNDCAPGFSTFFNAGQGVVGALTSLSTGPGLAGLLNVQKQFLSNLAAGLSLTNAATAALAGQSAMSIISIGTAITQGAGTFAATAAQATTIAAVGSVYSALVAGYLIGTAVVLVTQCKQWKAAHACGSRCCDNGFTCADPSRALCCPTGKGTACGSACCAFVCADPSISLCCASTEFACGGSCCANGTPCSNGVCGCPTGQSMCGSTCCANGTACNNGVCGCPAGQSLCGSTCCANGTPCTNGVCACPAGQSICGSICCAKNSTCAPGADAGAPGTCVPDCGRCPPASTIVNTNGEWSCCKSHIYNEVDQCSQLASYPTTICNAVGAGDAFYDAASCMPILAAGSKGCVCLSGTRVDRGWGNACEPM